MIRPVGFRAVTATLLLLSSSALAGEVVVYSPHGGAIRDEFVAAFGKAHPDTPVRWLDMGAGEVLERIRAEKDRPAAHVWWGGPATFFMLAGREGLLEAYRPSWADAVPPYARGDGDLWFGQFDLPIGIGYVPGRIPEDELPRTWDALLDPARPGRLVIRDPPASGTMRTFLAAMILRQETVDAGFAWLARLHERTDAYAAKPEFLYQQLSRGEGDLTVWNVTDLLFQHAVNDYPFAVIVPEEGVPVITDGIALVAGAGEDAKLFYEFVTSIPSNLRLAEAHYRFPTRRDLPAEELPEWLTSLTVNPMKLDRERMAEEIDGWTARWEREVRGVGGGRESTIAVVAIAAALAVAAVLVFAARRRRAHEDV